MHFRECSSARSTFSDHPNSTFSSLGCLKSPFGSLRPPASLRQVHILAACFSQSLLLPIRCAVCPAATRPRSPCLTVHVRGPSGLAPGQGSWRQDLAQRPSVLGVTLQLQSWAMLPADSPRAELGGVPACCPIPGCGRERKALPFCLNMWGP